MKKIIIMLGNADKLEIDRETKTFKAYHRDKFGYILSDTLPESIKHTATNLVEYLCH